MFKDAYNVALKYLKDKHKLTVLTAFSVPQGILADNNDHTVYLLLKQYYYGTAPKKELEEKLTSMGIEFEKKYT
jgi:hypothetical protein